MRESPIEAYLVDRCAYYGGVAEKFKSPQRKNVPDRLCSWPFGDHDFVELKATDVEPNAGQLRDHKRRREMGHRVFVIDSKEKVDIYVQMAYQRYLGRKHEQLPMSKMRESAGHSAVPKP